MSNILENKKKGRNFESSIRKVLSQYCYVFKKGVSTPGVDIVAIYSLPNEIKGVNHISFIIEAKISTNYKRILNSKEILERIKKNFREEIIEFLTKTKIFPLAILIIKEINKYWFFVYDFEENLLYRVAVPFKTIKKGIEFFLDLEVFRKLLQELNQKEKEEFFDLTEVY